MATTQTIIYLSDNIIQLTGLADSAGDYQNSATVTVTLTDRAGTEVVGETWPLTMVYVTSSDGNYKATLKDTLTLTRNVKYVAKVSANAGDGKQRYWEIPVIVLVDQT